MYHVFAFATPNSVKVPIALEELGLDYELHAVDVKKGEQKRDDFLALNPNGRVPVLTDTHRTFVLTESAAIHVHLAELHGKLLPTEVLTRARTFEQLFVHASALSPAFGQAGYFRKVAPAGSSARAIERFGNEAQRQLGLLDRALAQQEFVAGDDYSIADIAHLGWIWRHAFPELELTDTPNVARWYDSVGQRPAVTSAIARVEILAATAS